MALSSARLKIENSALCRMDGQIVSIIAEMPVQEPGGDKIIIDASKAVKLNFSESAQGGSGTSGKGEISQSYSEGSGKIPYGPRTDERAKCSCVTDLTTLYHALKQHRFSPTKAKRKKNVKMHSRNWKNSGKS